MTFEDFVEKMSMKQTVAFDELGNSRGLTSSILNNWL